MIPCSLFRSLPACYLLVPRCPTACHTQPAELAIQRPRCCSAHPSPRSLPRVHYPLVCPPHLVEPRPRPLPLRHSPLPPPAIRPSCFAPCDHWQSAGAPAARLPRGESTSAGYAGCGWRAAAAGARAQGLGPRRARAACRRHRPGIHRWIERSRSWSWVYPGQRNRGIERRATCQTRPCAHQTSMQRPLSVSSPQGELAPSPLQYQQLHAASPGRQQSPPPRRPLPPLGLPCWPGPPLTLCLTMPATLG